MRRRTYLLLMTCLVVAIANVAGCATTPTNQWAQARVALTMAEKNLMIAHASGFIEDEQLVDEIDPMIQGARGALDKAESFLPEGGIGFIQSMDLVEVILLKLQHYEKLENHARSSIATWNHLAGEADHHFNYRDGCDRQPGWGLVRRGPPADQRRGISYGRLLGQLCSLHHRETCWDRQSGRWLWRIAIEPVIQQTFDDTHTFYRKGTRGIGIQPSALAA